jgi:hypothetical protein
MILANFNVVSSENQGGLKIMPVIRNRPWAVALGTVFNRKRASCIKHIFHFWPV